MTMSDHINPPAFELESDEKFVPVMVYANDALVCGQIVTKQQFLAMRLLTGISTPDYVTIHQSQYIPVFGGHLGKPINHPQFHIPVNLILAYHLLPPLTEPYDFDENEPNRIMNPLMIKVGSFTLNAHLRISAHSTVMNFISAVKADFISVYDLEVIFPNTGNMPPVETNMAIVRRECVYFVQ